MRRNELIGNVIQYMNKNYHRMYERRLFTCTAWYYDYGNVIILKSYNTYVAVYMKNISTLYVFDYYSATTSQHVSKFIKIVNPIYVTYLYRRSDRVIERAYSKVNGVSEWKLKKSEYDLMKECDFSTYIISDEKSGLI